MKPAILPLPFLLVVLAGSAQGADPPCVTQCEQLVRDGELRDGVSPKGCLVRVCPLEARGFYRAQEFEKALLSLEPVKDALEESPSYQLELGLSYYALGRFPRRSRALSESWRGSPRMCGQPPSERRRCSVWLVSRRRERSSRH